MEQRITKEQLDAIAMLMDDDIREDMSSNYVLGFEDPIEFLAEYKRRHADKFDGEGFFF